MARLRYNGCSGTLGAAHNDSTTTLTLASKLTYEGGDVPTIASPDYLPLSILDADGKCAEVVHVTAYTSAATSATITRGAEGTTASAHDSGASFVNGPTVLDFHYGTRWPIDDETTFESQFGTIRDSLDVSTATAIPSGWSWGNQGDSTFSADGAAATLHASPTGGSLAGNAETDRAVLHAFPSGGAPFKLVAKLTGYNGAYGGTNWRAGILVANSSTNVNYRIYLNNNASIRVYRMSDYANSIGSGYWNGNVFSELQWPMYLRMDFDTTSIVCYSSIDGATWVRNYFSDIDPSSNSCDRFGFFAAARGTATDYDTYTRFEWVRVS